MVKQVTAFLSSAGRLFQSSSDALHDEQETELNKLLQEVDYENRSYITVQNIIRHKQKVIEILLRS